MDLYTRDELETYAGTESEIESFGPLFLGAPQQKQITTRLSKAQIGVCSSYLLLRFSKKTIFCSDSFL
jgi:hypothetical protein